MSKIVSFTLAIAFTCCCSLMAQDTRITPGISGLKSGHTSGEKEPAMKSKSDSATCESTCEGEECPVVAKAMEDLPKMVFRIGDQETCCHMTATRMAHEAHEEIEYVVGKKKFRDSQDAFESLVKQTETYVKKFVTPKVCNESGTTSLAGESCQCPDAASKMTDLVTTATGQLKLTYRVGEKEFDKYHDARRFAKKSHQKGMYVVAGEKFENELEARLALAHQKYRSAVVAIQTLKAEKAKSKADGNPEVASNDG